MCAALALMAIRRGDHDGNASFCAPPPMAWQIFVYFVYFEGVGLTARSIGILVSLPSR